MPKRKPVSVKAWATVDASGKFLLEIHPSRRAARGWARGFNAGLDDADMRVIRVSVKEIRK